MDVAAVDIDDVASQRQTARLLGTGALVGALVLAGNILGFTRDLLLATLFGASAKTGLPARPQTQGFRLHPLLKVAIGWEAGRLLGKAVFPTGPDRTQENLQTVSNALKPSNFR